MKYLKTSIIYIEIINIDLVIIIIERNETHLTSKFVKFWSSFIYFFKPSLIMK